MSQDLHKVLVFGAGPHFIHRHLPSLQGSGLRRPVELSVVVDLQSRQQEVRAAFAGSSLQPTRFLFLNDRYRLSLSANVLNRELLPLLHQQGVESSIVSTEPKAHVACVEWALHQNLHCFVDKPLSVIMPGRCGNQLVQDHGRLVELARARNKRLVMSCERRSNPGYCWIRKYLAGLIKKYEIPITAIDIFYGDGLWTMPSEYETRENHPHRYGYGVLFHSGYHYVELLESLVGLNRPLCSNPLRPVDLHCMSSGAREQAQRLSQRVYQKLLNIQILGTQADFHRRHRDDRRSTQGLGEADLFVMGRYASGHRLMTDFSLRLMESTVSQRSWSRLPANPYLGNGRLHLETVTVHLGPLCMLRMTSDRICRLAPGAGSEFDIEIISNAAATDLPPLVRLRREDLSRMYPELRASASMNVWARSKQLHDFLNGDPSDSDLVDHGNSIATLGAIVDSLQTARRAQPLGCVA